MLLLNLIQGNRYRVSNNLDYKNLILKQFEIPTDVHDKFVAMNLKHQGNRVINLNENIQRVEMINMKYFFNFDLVIV